VTPVLRMQGKLMKNVIVDRVTDLDLMLRLAFPSKTQSGQGVVPDRCLRKVFWSNASFEFDFLLTHVPITDECPLGVKSSR